MEKGGKTKAALKSGWGRSFWDALPSHIISYPPTHMYYAAAVYVKSGRGKRL